MGRSHLYDGDDLAWYGWLRSWPRPYIAWRGGWWWARNGWCPCCYSSPPDPHCPVCGGEVARDPSTGEVDRRRVAQWIERWENRCKHWRRS